MAQITGPHYDELFKYYYYLEKTWWYECNCGKNLIDADHFHECKVVDYPYMGYAIGSLVRVPNLPEETVDSSHPANPHETYHPQEEENEFAGLYELFRVLKCQGCGRDIGRFYYPEDDEFEDAYARNYIKAEKRFGSFLFLHDIIEGRCSARIKVEEEDLPPDFQKI